MTLARLAIAHAPSRSHERRPVLRVDQADPYLLVATLLLIAYGLVIAYSATFEYQGVAGEPGPILVRAALYALLALAVMVGVSLVDYAWLGTFAPLLYLITLVLLALVLVAGHSVSGGQRWVTIAGQRFQFSEFAKVLMIVVLAKWFADRHDRIGSPLVVIGGLLLLGPAVMLVYRQPDLGTSLVFIGIFLGMGFLAGARLWQLCGLVAGGIATLPLIWSLLQPYQQSRLTAFHDPYADPQGAGWNIIQSLIAVGSGAATGKGLTAGTQSPLGYLPIAESDFVFAGLAEDLGFAGAAILLALYLTLLLAALRVAYRARDPFGTFLGGGVVAMLAFQIVVNVGMAISLMPVTGIPLPFISQGGSSLISICLALGLLQSVAMRREPERLSRVRG
ncbi:MAG: rod shape-determining protein RodA [Chloroflexota bacterium]|nr:rod shape-determining protein RodA [Chloroflexota bacterium]